METILEGILFQFPHKKSSGKLEQILSYWNIFKSHEMVNTGHVSLYIDTKGEYGMFGQEQNTGVHGILFWLSIGSWEYWL